MDREIDTDEVLKAVGLFNRENAPGRLGSLKFPHELLSDETGKPLLECEKACERAAEEGLLLAGKIERKRWQLSEIGRERLRRLVSVGS
jgi:hypothetical protein